MKIVKFVKSSAAKIKLNYFFFFYITLSLTVI